MQPKKSRKKTIIIVLVLIGIILAAFYYVITILPARNVVFQTAVSRDMPQKIEGTKTTYGLPVRLKILKLQVDVNILYVGLTPSGDMEAPAAIEDVGWYKYGPHPGDVGSAVIAGHLESYKDLGVFSDLAKLKKGDIVQTIDDAGKTTKFSVRESKTYNQYAHASEVFQNTDGAHLNLITCTGVWNEAQKRYSHRLVIFTDKLLD